MTIAQIREKGLVLLECISGSRAYNLATETSDTDIKGVFLLPKKQFYGLNYIGQVNNSTNDIAFYELGRFVELLSVNNPNILELLNTPEQAVVYKHPLMQQIVAERILSKQCENTFGRFALSQIKKARGLNKKVLNPMEEERKSILSFCYVAQGHLTIPIEAFLQQQQWEQQNCGLTAMPHMKDTYALFHSDLHEFKGIISGAAANDVQLSTVPKGVAPAAIMYFNKQGYTAYCKKYKQYWEWVAQRNDDRYAQTVAHGKSYDAKNMMHTFRLLQMAIEIAREQEVRVQRPDRDFLLSIKTGKFTYEELLEMAEHKQQEMEAAFAASALPEKPNVVWLEQLLYELREELYG